MDKDFIETCKLLKKHYTKLTRPDASTQSNGEIFEPNVAEVIINDAKNLLLYEQLDALSEKDIECLRQTSVLKYAKTLKNYIIPKSSVRRYNCHKNHIRWNDEVFGTDILNSCNPNTTKVQRLAIGKLDTNCEGNKIIDCLNKQAIILKNQKANMNEQKLLQKERNEEQMNEYIDNLLNINIDDNIDKILDQYSLAENVIHLHNKIKEDVLKQHEEIVEKLELRYKFPHTNKKINKIPCKSKADYNDIEDIIQEWEEEKHFTDTYELGNNELIIKENTEHFIETVDAHAIIENEISLINESKIPNKNNKMDETVPKILTSEVIVEKYKNEIINNRKDSVNNEDNIIVTEIKQNVGKISKFDDIPELNIIPQNKIQIENFLEISKIPLTTENNQQNTQPNHELLREFFTKWRNINKENKNTTANIPTTKKIETFLENFQNYKEMAKKSKSDVHMRESTKENKKIKPKSSSNLENKIVSFENRFKAQKNIIEAQKAKLAEQNKMIQDLKLNKIKILAEESVQNAQIEIRKSISNLSKYKSYIKPEQKIENDKTEIGNGLSASLNLTKAPKIVQCMEERARKREEKRLLIKERKRLIEEEKKRLVVEAIQRKMKEEAEQKQIRLEKLKEQRKFTRELELQRQLEKKHFIEINEMAYAHYKNKLIRSSINKLKMLIFNVRIKAEIANRFYENNIVLKQFKKWRIFRQSMIENKTNIADNLYNNKLYRKCFDAWKSIYFKQKQNEQVAIDRYDMSLQSKVFIAWHALTCEYHIQSRINLSKAEKKYSRNLLFQCFHSWRSLPAIMQIERNQNERKRKWRLRVAEILPDYDPMNDYE